MIFSQFFIDEKYQGKGYGFTAAKLVLEHMKKAGIKEQGFIPTYQRTKLTDNLHEACGFRTDFEFINKSQMKTIQKNSKGR